MRRERIYCPSETMVALWSCYYVLTAEYDARICTARNEDGPIPRNAYEYTLANAYAAAVIDVIKLICDKKHEAYEPAVRDTVLRLSDGEMGEKALKSGYVEVIRRLLGNHADQSWNVEPRRRVRA